MTYKEMKPGLTPDCQTLSTGSMWTFPAALLLDLEGQHVLVLILRSPGSSVSVAFQPQGAG